MTHEGTAAPPRLLLIDDDEGRLAGLKGEIEKRLTPQTATIDAWRPERKQPVLDMLTKVMAPRPTLVVTDHDLTESGPPGLMGGSIISWCRAEAIPVGDYSQKLEDDLAEPDLFEFRFSSQADEAAVQIVDVLQGFHELASTIEVAELPNEAESWSAILAKLLGRETAASSFSLYASRSGASPTTIARLSAELGKASARRTLATYVLGHLLHNGILRYPGPIVGERGLCSYLAIADEHAGGMAELFATARYTGPFGGARPYFWQEDVDDILLDKAETAGIEGDLADAQFRRAIMSRELEPGTHACPHCPGDRGGYRCPYTDRTLCDLPQCSVPTSSWIPQGAYLTRVDKDYYDQWSPMIGL